jgi:hypothetical protein
VSLLSFVIRQTNGYERGRGHKCTPTTVNWQDDVADLWSRVTSHAFLYKKGLHVGGSPCDDHSVYAYELPFICKVTVTALTWPDAPNAALIPRRAA